MAKRDELQILQRAAEKAIAQGWQPVPGTIAAVTYVCDPPAVVIHPQPLHATDNHDMYLPEYFPLLENDFALAFWGKHLERDFLFGALPAWQYHQLKLLHLLQCDAQQTFFEYMEGFI